MLKGNPNFQGMSSQTRLKTCFDFNKKIKNSLIKNQHMNRNHMEK